MTAGSTLHYAFALKAGYAALSVRKDSLEISASGDVVVSKNFALTAEADTIIVADGSTSGLVSALRDILTNPSPMSVMRQLQDIEGKMAVDLSTADVQRRINAARVLAYTPADSAALRRVMREISDSLQAEDLGPQLGSLRMAASANPSSTGTTFIYVNGILTDPAQMTATKTFFLVPLLGQAGYSDRSLYPVKTSYNQSGVVIQNGSTWDCLNQRALAVAVGYWSVGRQIAQCFPFVADVAESARQVISETLLTLPPTSDVTHLAQIVRGALAEGNRVVIIAHSQGNLVARDALTQLAQGSSTIPMGCIGVVSIAPPVLIPQEANGASVSSMVIKGTQSRDILLTFGLARGVPQVTNELSDAWDGYFFLPYDGWNTITSGLDLHMIEQSYMVLSGTRQAIIEAVQTQVGQVAQHCASPAPPAVTVTSPIPNNGDIRAGSGGIDVDIPVHVASSSGSLPGTAAVSVQLFLSDRELYRTTTTPLWSGTIPVQAVNASGGTTSTARVHLPSNLSPSGFYGIYGQASQNGIPLSQSQLPIASVLTVFSSPLTQLPPGFVTDALYPGAIVPYTSSVQSRHGARLDPASGVVFGVQLSTAEFRAGVGTTAQAAHDYYQSYLTSHGYSITYNSGGGVIGSIGADPFTATDAAFTMGLNGGSLAITASFVHRTRY